jgi:hypothetical protein
MAVDRQDRPDRADGAGRDRRDQLDAAAVERDQHHQGDAEADHRSAAEREVDRRHERHERDGGEHPHEHRAPGHEAERQDHADAGVGPKRVPVADRLVQPPELRPGREHPEDPRIEPGGDRVRRDGGDPAERAERDRDRPVARGDQDQRAEGRDVDEQEADVGGGGRAIVRPQVRDGRPRPQEPHGAKRDDRGARDP